MWTLIGDDICIPSVTSWTGYRVPRVLPLLPVPGGYRVVVEPVDSAEPTVRGPAGDCGRLAGLLDGKVDTLCTHCLNVFRCRPGATGSPGFRSAAGSPSAWTVDDLAGLMATREIPSCLVLPRKHWRAGRLPPEVRLEFGREALLAALKGLLQNLPGELLQQRDFCRYLLAADGVQEARDETLRSMARRRLQALHKFLLDRPPGRYREQVETLGV